jgi:hypothetical protein
MEGHASNNSAAKGLNTCLHEGGGGSNSDISFDEFEQMYICHRCGQQLPSYAASDAYVEPNTWSSAPLARSIKDIVMSSFGGDTPLTYTHYHTNHLPLSPQTYTANSRPVNRDILERVCGNHHIAKSVELEACNLIVGEKYCNLRQKWRIGNDVICAYALYRACIKCKCARNLDVIAQWFDILPSAMWKVENRLEDYCEEKVMPSDGQEFARQYLNISHTEAAAAGRQADYLYETYTSSPKTLLAVCLFIELQNAPSKSQQLQQQGQLRQRQRTSLRQCATACCVSATSVSRLYRKIIQPMS